MAIGKSKKTSSKNAPSKAAKISQAQQYTLFAVLGAGIFLGAAISLVSYFTGQIGFNAKVISEEDAAIDAFSDTIKNVGICPAPSGKTYTDKELKDCNPNAVEVSSVPGTLRSAILQNLASNTALNSVPKESTSSCINTNTGKNFTYNELNEIYDAATSVDDLVAATDLIKSCSALRIIPDALPSSRNEEALLSSLNKIFILSNWEPEVIRPTGEYGVAEFDPSLSTISVRFSVETNFSTTMTLLNNIERSIREFDIQRATIEWSGENRITMTAQATAFYASPATLPRGKVTITGGTK